MRSRLGKNCIALFLLTVLLLGLCTVSAFAEEAWETEAWQEPWEETWEAVWDEGLDTGAVGPEGQYYPSMVYLDDTPADIGYLYVDRYFIGVDTLCRLVGIELTAGYEDGVTWLVGRDFSLFYEEGLPYICINHRYFWADYGFVLLDGRVCVPVSLAERLFHAEAYVGNGAIYLYTEGMYLTPDDPDYYAHAYGAENWDWLTRVVYAEGYRESLEGKVAIANVVLNRVNHPNYPDTVKEVVFDTVGGLQFAVVKGDELYEQPDLAARIAAALALDGENKIGDCQFFVSPAGAKTEWFDRNLDFYCAIGNQNFYRLR